MIEIKNIDRTVRYTAPVNKEAVFHHELMSEEYVQLQFNEISVLEFPIGCYIEYDGRKYFLIGPVYPEIIAGGYRYNMQFAAEWMRWKSVTCFYINEFTQKTELSWSLTATPDLFLKQIVDNIKRATGKTYAFAYDSSLTATKDLQFDNSTVLEALSSVAEAFETEWWIAGTVIHLSRCEYGESVALTYGENIGIPTPQGESEYATRIYAYGSTRNITQDYRSSGTTNALVQKRLTLPADKYPGGYFDIRPDLAPEEIIEKSVIFDDIYPSSDFPISAVRVDPKTDPDTVVGEDENGNPVYATFPIYFFKIAGIDFSKDLVIEGLTLKVHFLSGELQGREFELIYHEDTKEYEIITDQESGAIKIPNETLLPADGDIVVLFNIEMPQEYVTSAELRLEKEAKEFVNNTILADNHTYNFSSNPVAFAENDISLSVGRKVLLDYGTGKLDSRVLSVEFPLDTPSKVEISVGESAPKGKIASVETEMANVSSTVEVIQAYNDVRQTIQNVYGRAIQSVNETLLSLGNMWWLDKSRDESDSSKWIVRSRFDVATDRTISQKGPAEGGSGDSTGGVGTMYHDQLKNLDYPDQHPVKAVTGLQAALDSKLDTSSISAWALAATKPAYSWGEITDKPGTLGGYGITDAVDSGSFHNHVEEFNRYVQSGPHLTETQHAVLGMLSVDAAGNLKISGNAYTSGWLSQAGGTSGSDIPPAEESLEEKMVPGEFWFDYYGNKQQVYRRTFIGTTSPTVMDNSVVTLLGNLSLSAVHLLRCSVYDSATNSLKPPVTEIRVDNGNAYFIIYNVPDTYWTNRKFIVTIDYTKG